MNKKLENKHILHRFYKNYMRSYLWKKERLL